MLTQADLHRHWRALMGELGFSRSRLYVQIFYGDGRCTPVLLDVADLPDLPDASSSDRLMQFCAQAVDDLGDPAARVALLYARPGTARRRASDVAWAQQLTTSARRFGVLIFPVHVATDEMVTVVAPDDVGRPA